MLGSTFASPVRKRFAEFYPPETGELDALWEHGLIVLDANVLLNVYRIRDATRAELLGTLEKYKERLWVPYQFALEYQRNRLEVIAEQAGKYAIAAEHARKLIVEFESDRAPFVKPDSLKALQALQEELEAQRDATFALLHDDPHLVALSTLLEGRLGDPPESTVRSAMLEQARARLVRGTPPGNRDAWKARRDVKAKGDEKQGPSDVKKPAKEARVREGNAKEDAKTAGSKGGDESARDEADEESNVYGDCIGWLQILDRVQAGPAPCILLTDDRKEDWWQFEAGRRIGPLPSLVREFRERSGQRFHMYLPSRFLEWAKERGLDVQGATIKELAELEQDQSGIKAKPAEEPFEEARPGVETSADKRERKGD